MTFIKKSYLFLLVLLTFICCVETFEYKTITYESVLVVEASITSENKKQRIKLSSTIKIENSEIIPESNAVIEIVDDLNNVFSFTEDSPGNYISDISFNAKKDVSYQLKIRTQDNKIYISKNQKITGDSPLQKLTVKAKTNIEQDIISEGIEIYAESYDSERKSNYYRYEYEETFKIIAPLWVPQELEIVSNVPPYKVKVVNKKEEKRTCYKTNISDEIIQTETFSLTEDRVLFPVKYIQKSDFTIKHRYSILVKQFIQTREAYSFYKTLGRLSSSESLFSQFQPGTLVGNIHSVENPDENVLGFFEVVSVSSKRIFLNYTDFFDKTTRPKHLEKCFYEAFRLSEGMDEPVSPLIEAINKNEFVYFEKFTPDTTIPYSGVGPYILTTKSCGDCTAIGSNIKPVFWVD